MHKKLMLLLVFSILLVIPISQADAGTNANLSVSAENSKFDNHFAGSMVIEVVIRDSSINDTDEGKGEPDVTINGKNLRMVQATDGNWYAYFANVNKAKVADSTVGLSGEGLDFGVFCGRNTSSLGIDLSETDGVAIPRSSGVTGFTNGQVSFSSCTGTPTNSVNLNNVVRKAKSINTNPNISPGQIGLDPDAWPLIQLFSFNDVTIQYNPGGSVQQVDLEYDDIPNIFLKLDRTNYPQNSEVFVTINDIQLNQDPTDEDSWTFNINSPNSVFYQAYDSSGKSSANGNEGLVDLKPHLSNLGFEDNGILSIDLKNVIGLKSNQDQPNTFVDNGAGKIYSKIVTLVEEGPYSGVFDNVDDNDQSTTRILNDAPRGQTGRINYNQQSVSVLTGPSTGGVSLGGEPVLNIGDGSKSLRPGTEFSVVLIDNDQNINSGSRDHLDIFRETAIIPTLEIGNPITLENAFDFQFFTNSNDNSGVISNSAVPDRKSDRLIIDTSNISNGKFEKISFNLGISASKLQSILIDSSKSNSLGTNWLNFDLQSFSKDYGINDFSDTSVELSFGSIGSSPITIVTPSQMSSNGFIQLDDSTVKAISSKSGSVFVVINFDSSNNDIGVGTISNEINKQPIVFDFFSFGLVNNKDINNSIYRFELEETSDNSSKFIGTLEYAVTNQLNILDPNFIRTINTIGDEVKFIVTDKLVDEEGISINYSDLAEVGVVVTTSAKSDINTNSGRVSLDSSSYRFGQPVTITLIDADLNLKSDSIDTYQVINDPSSPYVDSVGKDGTVLLEILIKDIPYKRCTISGIVYGGLASTGFSLVETGTSTGVFKGVFKMPSQICDKSGTKLISSAGGSLDAKYYDARDSSGESNIFSLSSNNQSPQYSNKPTLSQNEIILPTKGNVENIVLSGNIPNHKVGLPLTVILIQPDEVTQKFPASLNQNGDYKGMISINENSLTGLYEIQLSHNNVKMGSASFMVLHQSVPDSIKNNAKWWSINLISDSEFVDSLEELIDQGIIKIPSTKNSLSETLFPEWWKTTTKWWSNDEISDDEFLTAIEFLAKKGIIRI
ncbi:MAG: peptidase [Nitrosopumilus sp.]|nr:peptidase [Nitrosopumilus sp.]MDH3384692.1 peptidase [Nitrosopumilus sp.]